MSLHRSKVVSGRLIAKGVMICCAASLLAGCLDIGATSEMGTFRAYQEKVVLLPAEECAIGYDLAQQVYNLVQVTKTVIIVSPKLGDCGEHAIKYLRRAGYAVDETATQSSAHQFSIATYEDKETGSVFATAFLPGLKITRGYKRGQKGMYPLTPVGVVYEDKI